MSHAAQIGSACLAAMLCWTATAGAAEGSPQRSTARGSPSAAALVSEARALLSRHQLDAANAKCHEALALDPDSAIAHDLLGFVLGLQGHTPDAIADFGRARRSDVPSHCDRITPRHAITSG